MEQMNTEDVERMTKFSNAVYNAAEHVVSAMQNGERIQVKTLAQEVGLKLSESPKEVMVFVDYFAHHTSLGYVARGKHGGLIKGPKVVKPSKKSKKSDVSATESNDTSSSAQ